MANIPAGAAVFDRAYPIQRQRLAIVWLLLAMLLGISLTLAAEETNLTVYVDGVSGELRDNVAAYLSINQLARQAPAQQEPESESLVDEARQAIEDVAKPVETLMERAGQAVQIDADQPLSQQRVQVDESRLRWLHASAEEEIRRALQPYGYYEPEIKSQLTQTEQGWVARYQIKPGPALRIDTIQVTILGDGADDDAFQELIEAFPLEEGDRLVQPLYEDFKQELQFLATQRGYFDAEFVTRELRIDVEEQQADILLRFATGRRYRFGQINFSDTALAPEFLRRYLRFQPGDAYNTEDLMTLQSALINSDYFSRVTVNAPTEAAEDYRIPVNVDLTMAASRQLGFGIGYGTDTGVRGRISYEYRWLNRRGHRLNTEVLASQIKQAAAVEYVIPGTNPATDSFNFRAALSREDSDVKDTSAIIIGGGWEQRFGRWQQILALDYTIESFRADEEQISRLLIPRASWIRTQTDDPLNPRRGTRFELEVRGAYEPLLSDVSFLQTIGRAKAIAPLGERGRLIARTDLGTTTVSSFDDLPTSLRFFAGGDTSVRGFELDKIGPRDENGDVVGGKHLIVGSLEYEHRLWERWGAALFVDSGDAFNDNFEFKTGVGIGMRWFSPVGPVRVDIAHGLEDPGDTVRLHLTIGPEL